MRPARVVRAVAVGAVVVLATGILPAVVSAHPLGNFSINHYNGITVTPETVVVDHVLDMSEIPTFSERAAMDLDRDGEVAGAEATAWAAETCARTAGALRLEQDGTRLAGSVESSAIGFAPGQGALTLRLECRLDWSLLAPLSEGATSRFRFRDDTYAERIGWREVVVGGDGASIEDSDAPATTSSDRLLSYPPDPLASPADRSSASFAARAAVVAAGIDDRAMVAPATVTAASGADSGVPEGVPAELGALLESDGLDLVALLVALAVALGLGALHALSPGHGKTVMAAYLVGSRGTLRTAVGLGLVVTISHTAGVLILGAVTLGASSIVPVERLYPILGLVSGLIVLALGGYLLWGRLVAMRSPATATEHGVHATGHEHELGHDHELGHAHEQEHEHEHDDDRHAHPHPHPHPHAADDDGSHSHGPFRHRHTLPDRGTGWRGLASLGLAGGMVPSASALILLLGAVSVGRPELGIVLTLAFGVGMALVLAGVGVAVVVGRGAVARIGGSRIPARVVAAVPTLAGALVIAIGVVMTTQALISLELIATG